MQAISLTDQSVRIEGALDFDQKDGFLMPRRLPDWTRLQVPEIMNGMVTTPSGVRMVFASTTETIELDVKLTLVEFEGKCAPATFDLVVNDAKVAETSSDRGNRVRILGPNNFEMVRGEPATIRFDGLDATLKTIEIWLPHNTRTQLRSLRIDDGAEIRAVPVEKPRWIHHGSSISQCSEAYSPTQTWPATAARLANVELTSLGFGGQCHLDQFVARTMRDADADFLSLKVGINIVNGDTLRERIFAPALHGFLDTIREGHPDTPMVVASPIYCPAHEATPGPTVPGQNGIAAIEGHEALRNGALTLIRVRELVADVVQKRRQAGDARLHYLDGLELFAEADEADLPDRLHPNGAGYLRIGERFAERAFGERGLFHK